MGIKDTEKDFPVDHSAVRELVEQIKKRMDEARSPEEETSLKEEWHEAADHLIAQKSHHPGMKL